jgi:hypothetical protein
MNWIVFGRKWSWTNRCTAYYPKMFLQTLRKAMKNIRRVEEQAEIATRHLPKTSTERQ